VCMCYEILDEARAKCVDSKQCGGGLTFAAADAVE
jgi:hypothetical protein